MKLRVHSSYPVVALIFVLGALLTTTAFLKVRGAALDRLATMFEDTARDRVQVISRKLDLYRHELEGFRRFYEQSAKVTDQEFILYTEPMLEDPCVQSIEWIPCVRQNDRLAFEERSGIQIREQGSSGKLVLARERTEYYPVYFAAPFKLNEAVLGFDLGSNPERWAALARARDQGEAHSIELVRLVENPAAPAVSMVVAPVYEGPSGTVEERRQNLRGFVLGMYRIDKLARHTTEQLSVQGLAFLLEDPGAAQGNRLLYRHDPSVGSFDWDTAQDVPLKYEEKINVSGRTWNMTVFPNNDFIQAHLFRTYWWILPSGFLLTLLVMQLLRLQVYGRLRAERLADERTAALQETEKRLRGVLQIAPTGIGWVIDRSFRTVNAQVCEMTGYTEEELLGQSTRMLYANDEDYEHAQNLIYTQLHSSGKGTIEVALQRKDGRMINALLSVASWDSDDLSKGIIFSLVDITERRKMEKEKEQLSKFPSENPNAVLRVAEDGTILYANASSETLLRFWGAAEGTPLPENLLQVVEKAVDSGKGQEVEVECGGRVLLLMFAPVQIEEYINIYGRDITDRRSAEDDVLRSQRELEHIVNNTIDAIFRIDLEGNYTYGNAATASITGYSIDQFVTMNMMELVAPEYHDSVAERLRKRLSGNLQDNEFSFEIIHKKGHRVWLELVTNGVFDENGQLEAVQGVARDITERKRMMVSLQQSEQRFRDLFEKSANAQLIIRAGKFVDCNQAALDMLGYRTRAEFVVVHPSDLSPERQPDGRNSFEKSGEMIDLALKNGSHQFEWKHKRTSGAEIPVNVLLTAISDTDGNSIIHVVWIDITERVKAEAESARLMAAIEQLAETVVVTDAGGRVEYMNPAFEKISGYTREEIIGRNPRVLKSGKQDDTFYRQMWEMISAGKNWEGRFVNKRKDGSFYTEEASISPVHDASGSIAHYVAVKRDITQELLLEKQYRHAQKMSAVGRLAGGVAHEFNNILQTILGFCGMLLVEITEQESLRQDVHEIQHAAKRAAQLTRQLLTFSRSQKVEYSKVDINSLVENEKRMLGCLLEEGLKMEFELAKDLRPVKADVSQIDQVVMNLVVNARDAILDDGLITIRTDHVVLTEADARSLPLARPGMFVCLSVADTGTGMEQNVLEHVYEPFFTTKDVGKGTGLGLAIVYGIIEQHNGWIEIETAVGHGSVFKVYLPIFDKDPSREEMSESICKAIEVAK